MDHRNLVKGTLIQWGGSPDAAGRYGPIINLYACTEHDSETLKPTVKDQWGGSVSMLRTKYVTQKSDLFVFLETHPTRGSTWKVYSYRYGMNVWVLNKTFWKQCHVVSEPE